MEVLVIPHTSILEASASLAKIQPKRPLQSTTLKGHTDSITSIAFCSNGNLVLTGSKDKKACLWDVKTGNLLKKFTRHRDTVKSVAFSPDGTKIITEANNLSGISNIACLWDVKTGDLLKEFTGRRNIENSVEFSPDGKTVLMGSGDNAACL